MYNNSTSQNQRALLSKSPSDKALVKPFNACQDYVEAEYWESQNTSTSEATAPEWLIPPGDSPHFYDTSYFLPKVQVNTISHHILQSRKSPPKPHKSSVPHEAIDQCENSYEVADGKKQKSLMDSFDDTGVMALICRHDIPLFFANIDTPGEQQKDRARMEKWRGRGLASALVLCP
ncbi:uncharacterized protein EDB91DRAFT_1255981 [Suillus paluster]|uniref:uncharacterized protein n=1 Tax=Suillus paluster TaxID=48578 RepID=UPI001B876774|nr:uncharacterized protein EDB91DRAFT_1255981 [Suillus paluster]KAG1722589.1 hypothetical protein EDB91DRAFT_1255981 [Suillus paluster]